jgi:hypothetical protein
LIVAPEQYEALLLFAVTTGLWFITTDVVPVPEQPFASVTVTLYEPE